MINREITIYSLAITCGLFFLLMLPMLSAPPHEPEADSLLPAMPTRICSDIPLPHLRRPGGLSYTVAMVCVHDAYTVEFNTGMLSPEDYQTHIAPVKDSLTTVARDLGIRRESNHINLR